MRTFWFDARLDLRKGDLVRITKAIVRGDNVRASRIENVTKGSVETSRIEGVVMTKSPVELEEPILGRVTSVEVRPNRVTYFQLEEGILTNDLVFVPAGQPERGLEVLEQVIAGEIEEYLKVCDPYVSSETLDLLAKAPQGTKILLLTTVIQASRAFRDHYAELKERGTDIKVKVLKGLTHGRYILTAGKGWIIDHSLKDFGDKDSIVQRLSSSSLIEENFDERWTQAISS